MLNALFMVDEIFTGEFMWDKISDTSTSFEDQKVVKKNQTWRNQNIIQKCSNNKLKIKKKNRQRIV